MKSILDALLSQYVDPYKDWQAPMQMPQGAMQPQPGPQNAMQAMQAPMQAPMQGPMQGPGPAPQAPQPTQNPLSDVESALQAGVQQDEESMMQRLAFEEGVAPFENKWKNTQERRFGGWAGGIEAISDMVREKKLQPQRQAVDAQRARMMTEQVQQQQKQTVQDRAQALVKLGNDPETAFALAHASRNDKSFDPSKYDRAGGGAPSEEMKRQQRAQLLKENPQLVERIGQDAADKFWLTGNWSTAEGMALSMDKDGNVLFSQGGESIPVATTANKGEVVGELLGAEDTLETLNSIMEISDPNFLGYGARAKAFLGGEMDKLGMSDTEEAEFNASRSAWEKEILRRVMQYRKEITGVAGSPQEMKKIESIVLNPNMGKAQFAKEMTQEIRTAQRDANRNRRELGLPEVEWPEFEFKWPGGEDEELSDEDLVRMYQ
jgi:hypothetical protein